jgi:cytoskeletal protein CcmA (bactofilin family)
MPIFRRDNGGATSEPARQPGSGGAGRPHPPGQRGEPRAGSPLIAPGTRVTGRITGASEVWIEGDVDGEVRVDHTVVVGTGGRVLGGVSARTVRVAGRVAGDLRGAERVEVAATGKVEGDISAPRVVIAEGAFFKGSVEMSGDAGRPARQEPQTGGLGEGAT